MSEIWKPVAGYPDYEVSDRGRFRSIKSGKVLAQTPMHAGYLLVKLSRDCKATTLRAHSLVLESFVGPRPAGQVTRHMNGVRDDNRLKNLRWGTHKDNYLDAVWHGTHHSHYEGKFGASHPSAKLPGNAAIVIPLLAELMGQHAVAALCGVNQATISNVVRGKTHYGRLSKADQRVMDEFNKEWQASDATARAEMRMSR